MKVIIKGGQGRSEASSIFSAWVCLGCGMALGTILTLATMGVMR